MATYTVRSGQNIYDVALTLYGSVEGLFFILAMNKWLNMETKLCYGMQIEYNEDLAINNDIKLWINTQKRIVKNGEHIYNNINIENLIESHFGEEHQDILDQLKDDSADEQNLFWELTESPRIIILQQGQLSTIRVKLKPESHMVVEWGDYSAPQIIHSTELIELEHCYNYSNTHKITIYGDFTCDLLDLSDINGIYYPLGNIYVDDFITNSSIKELNKLIIPA